MAEDAEVGNKTSSTIKSVKNLLLDMAENTDVSDKVIGVMIKQSKDYFPRSWTYLQGILLAYALKKDEFSLIVLAMVETLS